MNSSLCVVFASASAPGSGTVVVQQDASASVCQMVVVELWVTDVDDLFGAAFTVNFDPGAVEYVDGSLSTAGSILGTGGGGSAVISDLDDSTPGELIVGISRTAPAAAIPSIPGTELLCRMTFRAVGDSGVSALTFADERLLDDSGPPLTVPATWSGGEFTIM